MALMSSYYARLNSSGTYQGWLANSTEYNGAEIYHTNAATYANGVVSTRVDERGLSLT